MDSRERIDLRQTVQECLAAVAQHPDDAAVALETRLDGKPVPVAGDADLLHRALFNLVLNAAQSAGAGGRVVVTLEDRRSRTHPRGTDIEHPVRLAVADSGPGVAPEAAARVFDPFYTTKERGSGLGLAVVHRAVEAHAGAVFVDRAAEGGAEFVIFLPGLPGGLEEDV
jgi:two-component system sensor histidine kinase PilS (NtrC family)